MLELGQIVDVEGTLWQVDNVNTQCKTCYLLRPDSSKLEIPNDADRRPCDKGLVKVVAHPQKNWPFVAVKISPKAGPIVGIRRPTGSVVRDLVPLREWTLASFLRPGGAVWFNPSVGLRQGETLVAVHRGGMLTRIRIGPKFGTIAVRKKRLEKEVQAPLSAFELLAEDD